MRVVILHVAGSCFVLASVLFDVSLAWSEGTALWELHSLHSLHVSHLGASFPSSTCLNTHIVKAGPGVNDDVRVVTMQ